MIPQPVPAALFALATLAISPAQASFYKTYVSSAGVDTADCSFAAPCQTFTRALTQTAESGEVNCLNGFGFTEPTIAITKTITIDCGAATGTFVASSAITINGAGIVVRLRSLKFQGINIASPGVATAIDFTDGAALILENCLIHEYSGIAVKFRPSTRGSQLIIKDSVISNNGNGSTGGGLQVSPQAGGTVGIIFDHATFYFNTTAMVLSSASGSIGGTMRDSVVASSRFNGIVTQAGSFISLLIDRSLLSNNVGSAIQSSGTNSFVRIGNSTISANDIGVSVASGGTVQSFKDNKIFGNSTDGTPLTAVPGYSGTGQ